MKTVEQILVSFYESRFSKSPVEVSLYDTLKDIRNGAYASPVNTIRRYFQEGDQQAAQFYKGKLPAFTASGTFQGSHAVRNLKDHSGVILIDFDHVENPDQLRECCCADSHTLFAFRSPTDGYKVAAYVEDVSGRHAEAYQVVSQYYQELTGVACDAACKDESRLCYVSYDPDAYIAALYEPFELPGRVSGRRRTEMFVSEEESIPETDSDSVQLPEKEVSEEEVKTFVMSYLFINPISKGKRNSMLFKLVCEAAKRGYPQKLILPQLIANFVSEDFPKEEVNQVLLSGYKRIVEELQKTTGKGDLGKMSVKMSECQYTSVKNEFSENEAYWKGEELRRNTPGFSAELYEKIPDMLADCIPADLTFRERDLLLLSLFTAYSSIMPETQVVYNHRKYGPNLFTMAIAPAGSGKSIAQLAGKLLQVIHQQILAESERTHATYQLQKREWEKDQNRKGTQKDVSANIPEPQEPPYKMLLIPATTSHSRMQLQLRDNGKLGGFILDTEAQSMANANNRDAGHFDDMLCKAFEHETISSSFKINGMRPVVIPSPHLSLLLTGTTGQLYHLVESAENGLLSRILLYTYREKPVWKEMGNEESDRDELYETLAQDAALLFRFCSEHPCRFRLTLNQWKEFNGKFRYLLSEVATEGNDHLQAIVKRHGFMVMRIAMILSRLKQYQRQSIEKVLYCEEPDFEIALEIVLVCYEHSRLILTSMPNVQTHSLKDPDNRRRFFEELPLTFTTSEAIKVGGKYDLAPRTVKRFLREAIDLRVRKLGLGLYEKTEN